MKISPGSLAAAERVVAEFPDRESTTEARYAGAYCLNVLRRFADAEAWIEKHFDPENPLEEAWRRVLGGQRDLLKGKVEQALDAVGSLDKDFPDPRPGCSSGSQAPDHAHAPLQRPGRSSPPASPRRAGPLDRPPRGRGSTRSSTNFRKSSATTVGLISPPRSQGWSRTPASPLIVRVAARERRARHLIEDNEIEPTVELLRLAIEKDPVEYARVRAALTLAEILCEPAEDEEGHVKRVRRANAADAAKVLADILPTIGRRDLAHQVRKAAEKYQTTDAKP